MPEMSRGTLMKWLYAYVKEHDLYVSRGWRGGTLTGSLASSRIVGGF
jgi:hypothetical protein